MPRSPDALSVLCITTLYPNPAEPAHGIFVETRLRKVVATGEAAARVVAPVPWLPRFVPHGRRADTRAVPSEETRHGIPVAHPRYVVVPKVGMSIAPLGLYRALRRSVAEWLAKGYRFDLIDAHYFYPDGVAAVRLARELNLPVVVTARGTDLNLLPRFRIPRRMIQNAAAGADAMITVCAALRDVLLELGAPADRVVVLRNGVDLTQFRPLGREPIRRELGLEGRTLVSVGHLIERKGHHHVIRALGMLPATRLLIVGSGPERASLEALSASVGVRDRVRFLGSIDQERLCETYNAADALVLASSREGWANVLLEAMACGTPVVASAVWGTPEVVASPEAGVLMPSLDAAGVVAGVERLFAEPPDRGATRRYAERFDWEPTTRGQLALFERVVAEHGMQKG